MSGYFEATFWITKGGAMCGACGARRHGAHPVTSESFGNPGLTESNSVPPVTRAQDAWPSRGSQP
jgi:hypothetical protein